MQMIIRKGNAFVTTVKYVGLIVQKNQTDLVKIGPVKKLKLFRSNSLSVCGEGKFISSNNRIFTQTT